MLLTKYPYRVIPAEEGGYLLQFIDLEEAFSEADSLEEAEWNAEEVLSLSLAGRIEDGFDVPLPTAEGQLRDNENVYWSEPTADIQVALLVHYAREEKNVSVAELARQLNTSWPSVQRFEKPGNNPTLKRLTAIANSLGKKLVIDFV